MPSCYSVAKAMSREATFNKLIADFPNSPMGYFSLGRLCLDEQRFQDAADAFRKACERDANYSAAWVGLGDALLGLRQTDKAKTAFQNALNTPHAQKDSSLQADLEDRLAALDDAI